MTDATITPGWLTNALQGVPRPADAPLATISSGPFEALQNELLYNPWEDDGYYEELLCYGLPIELPFYDRGIQLLFGDPGCGKSTLVAHLAAEASQSERWVLWCDTDGDLLNLRRRYIANGGRTDCLDMLRPPTEGTPRGLAAWLDKLTSMVRLATQNDMLPPMIVLDSLQGLLQGDGAADVSRVLRGLNDVAQRASVFPIDHANKHHEPGDAPWKRLSGSVQKVAASRVVHEVTKGRSKIVKSNIEGAPVGQSLTWEVHDHRIPHACLTEPGALRVLNAEQAILAEHNARMAAQQEFTTRLHDVYDRLALQGAVAYGPLREAVGGDSHDFQNKLKAAGYRKRKADDGSYIVMREQGQD